MATACWACNDEPMPLDGMQRLALCSAHLSQRVADIMGVGERPASSHKDVTASGEEYWR